MEEARDTHPYTFGLEEEYFLVRRNGRRLRHMPRRFFAECRKALGERFGSEMLQTQVEVQTEVHHDALAAERDLLTLRRTVGRIARAHGLGIVSSGTHPTALWRDQRSTDKPRYDQLMDELQMLGHRNLVCGLHVHVQPADPGQRVSLMTRIQPFLPLLLALSTSSPFWMGQATGLMGYRQTAYKEIPRTGLPPLFRDQADYDRYVRRMVDGRAIPDASFLWWAVRPSLAFPTLELRVPDACTDPRDALAIAQLFRCLVRHLECAPRMHEGLGIVEQAVIEENLWQAQRHGFDAGLIDPATGARHSVHDALESVAGMLSADIAALDCAPQMDHLRHILAAGTSAHLQRRRYDERRRAGHTHGEALADVVHWLADASVPV